MLGSPIRTPPDHSSVANSPGLIAGSYVLHRLLMPRHPPCALHSLSHKHSTKTTKKKDNTHHTAGRTTLKNHRGRHTTGVRAVRRQPLVKGCRQMLASTIHLTRSTPTPATDPPRGARRSGRAIEVVHQPPMRRLIPQGPTVCQHHPRAPPTSVPHPHHPSQGVRVVLGVVGHRRGWFIDDSTSETPPDCCRTLAGSRGV